tara:strand:+ start:55 stop:354 length:300 start_codon:yes stop_codon:yes gene_type:complete
MKSRQKYEESKGTNILEWYADIGIDIKVGDRYIVDHGATSVRDNVMTGEYRYVTGSALFIVNKITKFGNVIGEKWNINRTRCFNANYKLQIDSIKGEAF